MGRTSVFLGSAMRGVGLLFLLIAMTVFVSAQDLILNGDLTNAGTINAKRHIINNNNSGNTAVTVSGTGIVALTGNAGATTHEIKSNGTAGITFAKLDLLGGRTANLKIATTVADQLRIGDGATGYTSTFSIETNTLSIGATSSYDNANNTGAALTFSGGTVAYTSGNAQAVLNRTAGVTYGTLALSGAGAKTITTGGQVTTATLTQASGALGVSENLDVTGTATVAALADITAAKKLRFTAAATTGTITSMNNTATGTLENASNNTITVATLAGNAGTIDQSGASGSIAFTNDITNSGTIQTATGTLNFNGTGVQTHSGGSITVSGAGFVEVAGDISGATGGFSLASGSTFTYDGAAQALKTGVTYGTLVAGGTDAKTAGADLTVAGALTLNQNITQTGVLTLTSTTAANVTGSYEVIGSVRRFHDFTSGSDYRFNRADVSLGTATTGSTDITLTMTPATPPSGTLPSTKYINRKFAITPTTAGNLERVALAYSTAPSEEQGSIDNAKIGARTYNGAAWSKLNYASYTRNSSSGALTITGLSNSLTGVNELGMFQINYVSMANNAVLQTGAGWDEGSVPGASDDALINHTGVKVGTAALSVGTLTINAGMDLTVDQATGSVTATTTSVAGAMTVTAADANLGAVTTSGAGKVDVGTGRTLTASSFTNNTSGTSTFTGDVSFGPVTNTAGTLAFNGSSNSITGAVSNAASGVINVGGTLSVLTGGVSTLTSPGNISVTGTGTLNVGQTGVASILSMTGTSTLAVATNANLNVFGDLVLANGVTLSNDGTITVGE